MNTWIRHQRFVFMNNTVKSHVVLALEWRNHYSDHYNFILKIILEFRRLYMVDVYVADMALGLSWDFNDTFKIKKSKHRGSNQRIHYFGNTRLITLPELLYLNADPKSVQWHILGCFIYYYSKYLYMVWGFRFLLD